MKRPIHASPRANNPTLLSIWPLSLRPVFIMKTIMVTTKTAATSMTQPSKMSWFNLKRESYDGHADRSGKGGGEGGIDRFAQIVAADLGKIGQGDADDKSGFDAFAEGDDECLEHGIRTGS